MAIDINYKGNNIASLDNIKTAVIECAGKKMTDDLTIIVTEEGGGGKPIEVDTLDNSLLTAENDGKVYKCDDKLYQVNKVKSLKGLTIKFNKTITSPCPIGENDEFECSAFTPSLYDFWSYGKTPLVTIRKEPFYSYLSATSFISLFNSEYFGGAHYLSSDNQEETGWYYIDPNANEMMLEKDFVITEFDCPALNENPEFIEWVFANAKVYSKIETFNDIKAFKPNYSTMNDLDYFYWACLDAVREKTEDYTSRDWDIAGIYIASFKINGEVITRIFSHIAIPNSSKYPITFSNNSEDLLAFSYNWDAEEFAIKYNDIVLDEAPIFTAFDCAFNNTYTFLQYVLTNTELINMEYPNGCSFAEYMEAGEPELNIAYGETEPTDASKLWIKTEKPKTMKVTPNLTYKEGSLESGIAALPTTADYIGSATVGTAIYLFGGNARYNFLPGYVESIYVFDTLTNTLSRIAELPSPRYEISTAVVGTKVYLFGGLYGQKEDGTGWNFDDTISVFDTVTNQLHTIDTKLPEASSGIPTAVVGTKVYLFGSFDSINVRVFDTLTNTITTLSAELPDYVNGYEAAVVGTKVYLLVSYGMIVFDTLTNTITIDRTVRLPEGAGSGVSVIGTSIYYFGGKDTNTIKVFDTTSNMLTTLYTTLPEEISNFATGTVGTKVYMFGGWNRSDGFLDTINVFTAFPSLAHNNLIIEPSSTKNHFNLLPNVEMGVNAVYLGNEEGVGEKVSAALYKDGAWVEI